MKSMPFSLLKSKKQKKLAKHSSEKYFELPSLHLKFGPKTPIVSPYNTMRFISLPRESRVASLSPAPHSPSSPQGFIDHLVAQYEDSKLSHVDIASKFVKSEAIDIRWKILNPRGFIPDSRTGATMNIVNRFIYIFGGERSDQSNDIKKLDYQNLKWEKLRANNFNPAEVPNIRSGHTSVTYKHYLVVYGGFSSFDPSLQVRNCTSLVYFFDLITSIWKSHKPSGISPQPRRNHTSALVGNSHLVYSGLDSAGNIVQNTAILNLETMHWCSFVNRGEIPASRRNCTMTPVYHSAILEHYNFDIFSVPKHHDHIYSKQTSGVYLFGGLDANGVARNDIYIVKGQQNRLKPGVVELAWTKIIPTGKEPIPRHGHSANLVNGYLVIIGGRNDTITGGIVEELAILRISSWRWEIVNVYGDIPNARIGACSASFGNRIMMFGGMYLSGFASSAIYELETDQRRVTELVNYIKY